MANNFGPRPQFETPAGVPATNYTLSFFIAGTTTPKATYPTKADLAALTNANNTVLTVNNLGFLTSSGSMVDVWLNGSYKIVLADASAVTVYTEDNVNDLNTLLDNSGNKLIAYSPAASAVNYLTIASGATGVSPTITATGGDSNVDLNIVTAGTGVLKVNGSTVVTGTQAITSATTTTVTKTGNNRTNTIDSPLKLIEATIGTAAAGIGTGVTFQNQNGSGTLADSGVVASVLTTVTAASEQSSIDFQTRNAGAAPTTTYSHRATTAAGKLIHTHAVTADRTITWPDMDVAMHVIQEVHTQTGAVATGTTQIPWDDTIPQNTEGDQYMTLAITPRSASSVLRIDVGFTCCTTGVVGTGYTVALFQDTTANALAAVTDCVTANGSPNVTYMQYWMASGTTSSTTFKVRTGPTSAVTVSFNGAAGARKLGGVNQSYMSITEYSA